MRLGIEAGPFETFTNHDCVCGIGIQTAGSPASLMVKDVQFFRENLTTGEITAVFSEFDTLVPNSLTSAGLSSGQGDAAGLTWFGLSGNVAPFTPPPLGPDEFFGMSFTISVDNADLPSLLDQRVQFAAGLGDAAGIPQFGGTHPVQYWSSADPQDTNQLSQLPMIADAQAHAQAQVPEPSSLLIWGLAVVGVPATLRMKRRRTRVAAKPL